MMDTQLQYLGQLRHAERCGTLHGRDVYFISGFSCAVVLRSIGTADQTSPIFLGADCGELDTIADVQWLDNSAAARAKAWVSTACMDRAEKLIHLANKLRGVPS